MFVRHCMVQLRATGVEAARSGARTAVAQGASPREARRLIEVKKLLTDLLDLPSTAAEPGQASASARYSWTIGAKPYGT